MEDIINDLKKKVNNIEYIEIKELRDKICNMELSLNQNNLLTENCIKSNEKMSDTLDSIKETMIIISESVKQSNNVSKELADSVKSLGIQVNVLDDKMNEIDDKSKFDIADYLRRNLIPIVIGAGILGYLFLR